MIASSFSTDASLLLLLRPCDNEVPASKYSTMSQLVVPDNYLIHLAEAALLSPEVGAKHFSSRK
eukprot:12435196-Heterocapsa_arctica.AAC.1